MNEQEPKGRWLMTGYGLSWLVLTDANYGNELWIRADHVSILTIVSETTYREGTIPDGVFRRTLLYTTGGNQVTVREAPNVIAELLGQCVLSREPR